MAITKDKKSTTGGKPKHGMDKNRPNKDTGNMRSAATVRSLTGLHIVAYRAAQCTRSVCGWMYSSDALL